MHPRWIQRIETGSAAEGFYRPTFGRPCIQQAISRCGTDRVHAPRAGLLEGPEPKHTEWMNGGPDATVVEHIGLALSRLHESPEPKHIE